MFFVGVLGFYLILNLQWHSYEIERVLFHHSRPYWHIIYFLLPIVLYYPTKNFFWIFFYFMYLFYLFIWYKKQDKKLHLTPRVKRFFAFLFLGTITQDVLCLLSQKCVHLGVLLVLVVALLASFMFERYLKILYTRRAKAKLKKIKPIVVGITASFGKTSIKNFLYEFLKNDFRVQKSPRSVNTDIGLVQDINNNLKNDTQIYIAEAGARQRGDIAKIASLLGCDYVILGEIGKAHIEYFKSEENILKAKQEILLCSPKKAFFHPSAKLQEDDKNIDYAKVVSSIASDLEGVSWDLDLGGKKVSLHANILGKFNAYNISASFLLALDLGVDVQKLIERVARLEPIAHRLQKIQNPHKFIIDDSFNGNLQGMLEACELCKSYDGKRVVVTCGLVESDEASNEIIAKKFNEVFDLVIITGAKNMQILSKFIDAKKRVRLYDKQALQETIAKTTSKGDLILFANDSPTFM